MTVDNFLKGATLAIGTYLGKWMGHNPITTFCVLVMVYACWKIWNNNKTITASFNTFKESIRTLLGEYKATHKEANDLTMKNLTVIAGLRESLEALRGELQQSRAEHRKDREEFVELRMDVVSKMGYVVKIGEKLIEEHGRLDMLEEKVRIQNGEIIIVGQNHMTLMDALKKRAEKK